ncbi:hypothetical protein D3C71_854630 [compost metagenome]
MRPALAQMQRKGLINRRCAGKSREQRGGIDHRHIGALAQLRACRMPCIADADDTAPRNRLSRVVTIAGMDRLGDFGKRHGLRPQRIHPFQPRIPAGIAPRFDVAVTQAPEEGHHRRRAVPRRPDRQHTDHMARPLVTLLKLVGMKRSVLRPRHRRPERAIVQLLRRIVADR